MHERYGLHGERLKRSSLILIAFVVSVSDESVNKIQGRSALACVLAVAFVEPAVWQRKVVM